MTRHHEPDTDPRRLRTLRDLLAREGRAPRTFRRVLGYDAIVSYKCDRCESGPLPRACIVNFHGTPKPCDFTIGWVAQAVLAAR
jgi:hypothetical protein